MRRGSREDVTAFVWRLLVAGAACGLVLLVYNALAFGNPLHLGYQSEERFEELKRGFFGITSPEWWRIRELLVGSYRGLLPLFPLAGLAPVGLLIAARDPQRRATALAALSIALYYLVLNASYHYWEGGWAYGPRQIMSAMPFVALGLGPLWAFRACVVARPAGRGVCMGRRAYAGRRSDQSATSRPNQIAGQRIVVAGVP
jgi:hypothetical protein